MTSKLFWCNFILLLSSCCFNINEGLPGASASIEISKKCGVFVCEYQSAENPIIFDTIIDCKFSRIWLEKRWRYGKKCWEAIPFESQDRGSYQLIIETDEACISKYQANWYVALDGYNNLRIAGKSSFVMDIKDISDTMYLPILEGDYFGKYKRRVHKEVGQMVLFKMK